MQEVVLLRLVHCCGVLFIVVGGKTRLQTDSIWQNRASVQSSVQSANKPRVLATLLEDLVVGDSLSLHVQDFQGNFVASPAYSTRDSKTLLCWKELQSPDILLDTKRWKHVRSDLSVSTCWMRGNRPPLAWISSHSGESPVQAKLSRICCFTWERDLQTW